ncbi:isoflavone reductase [Pseudomassariella vexata]|uniref:Isoflavone reductase n=1 Tax=Pseudomassariella vexata TaxID=1141098 RepID=A0A1Y2DDG9_9PEZI|nr:isoflavone reductase [Pseudomassariella vexata]ORY57310.1 isoflavone reductase [Pseudomassariella vexata]
MMRIAIAGAGGFANILAGALSQTEHPLLVLSRNAHPGFEAAHGCQVSVVDYDNVENLRYNLMGIHLVISTISGTAQLNLIDAARRARVRCFVPSEFEGALSRRPTNTQDPLDRESSTARDWLQRLSSSSGHPMRFTVFSCGIFYERFAPGGLQAYQMGASHHIQLQGDYMIDVGNCTAEIPETNAQGHPVQIIMISVYDVARFVTAAVELGLDNWPREFRMRGAHLSTRRLAELCEQTRGVPFEIIWRPYDLLLSWQQYYEDNQNWERWRQMEHLIQTANGRYNYSEANLNNLVNFEPVGLGQWLAAIWGPII